MSRARPLLALLLAGLLLALGATVARAEGGPVAPPAPGPDVASPADADAAEAAPAPVTLEDFEEMLRNGPGTRWALLLLKVLPILLGLGFLIALYVTWHRRQLAAAREAAATSDVFGPGAAPPPPLPPPGPTVPFSPLPALAVTVGAILVGGLLAQLLAPLVPGGRDSLLFGMVFVGLIELPLALLVVFRRLQLRGGAHTPLLRSFGRAFLAFCVGSAVAFPLLLVGNAALSAAGQEPVMQDVILKATDRSVPTNLWLTAFFGVVVAPFVEEAIFRGLFFPAMRRAAGGGRRGFWLSAIVVSLLFAAIHQNAYALLPLFGLAMVLSWVMEKTDSLSTSMLGHAFYNASTMIPLLIARMEGVL